MAGKSMYWCFGVACWLFSQACVADIDYTYVEAGYEDLELDAGDVDVDGDGFYLGGSYALQNDVFVFGDYRNYGLDFSADLSLLEVGVGMHSSGSDTVQFVGMLGYFRGELETDFGDDDEDGYDIRLGLRAQPAPQFEYEVLVGYRNIDAYKTSASAALRYEITPDFSIQASALVGADITVLGVGLRVSFPR